MTARIADSPQVQKILADAEWKLEELLKIKVSVSIIKTGGKKYSRIKDDPRELPEDIPVVNENLTEYVSSADIMNIVAKSMHMKIEDHWNPSSASQYVILRKISSYILYKHYGSSYKHIARLFKTSNGDHTMHIYYVRSSTALINLKNQTFIKTLSIAIKAVNKEVGNAMRSEGKFVN